MRVVGFFGMQCNVHRQRIVGRRIVLERRAIASNSLVFDTIIAWLKNTQVQRDTWNPVGICEDHLARLNTPQRPIVNKYREGKVKSTPARGVKENLKPCAYKPLEL